jgi:RNA polymerase sigma-70 factor, ECF subfamily
MSSTQASPQDPRRFETLFREHGPVLLRQALRLCGNRSDACDLVQDTFERGWRSLPRMQPRCDVRAWLTSILGNLFIDRYRKARRHQARHLRLCLEQDSLAPSPEEDSPGWADFTLDQVREALAHLTERFRAVYELHALRGCSYAEIAARLGISPQTVGTRLLRARRMLRALLTERCAASGRTWSREPQTHVGTLRASKVSENTRVSRPAGSSGRPEVKLRLSAHQAGFTTDRSGVELASARRLLASSGPRSRTA